MEMSLFECDVYFAQSSQLCGYYLRVASNRRNTVHALSKRFTFTCSWYWYGWFSFSFHQKLSYRIPTAALAVPPIAFSHSSGQLYTKKDHTTHDTILMIYVRTHVHHSLVHFPFPAYINIHVSTPFPIGRTLIHPTNQKISHLLESSHERLQLKNLRLEKSKKLSLTA